MSQKTRHNVAGSAGVNLGLIITPMLDMSFQILSFFIMTYHPSALEGHVNGTLTPPSTPMIVGPTLNVPIDQLPLSQIEPELEETVSVIVKAIPRGGMERGRVDGEPAQIFIKRQEDTERTLVADTDEPIRESYKKLKARLKASVAGGVLKGNIRLDCEADLKHGHVMELYDVCKDSGFENVSFVAPVVTNQRESR